MLGQRHVPFQGKAAQHFSIINYYFGNKPARRKTLRSILRVKP